MATGELCFLWVLCASFSSFTASFSLDSCFREGGALVVCWSLRSELSPGRQQCLLSPEMVLLGALPPPPCCREHQQATGACRGRVLTPHLHRQAKHKAGSSCREHSPAGSS